MFQLDLPNLLQYSLRHLISWYFSEEGLNHYVLLDLQWVIDALKCVITAEDFLKNKWAIRKYWNELKRTGKLTWDIIGICFVWLRFDLLLKSYWQCGNCLSPLNFRLNYSLNDLHTLDFVVVFFCVNILFYMYLYLNNISLNMEKNKTGVRLNSRLHELSLYYCRWICCGKYWSCA